MMRKILTLLFATIASLVSAQDENPFDITFYGSFLHTDDVPNALFFFNDIEEYDSFELRRALRNHEIDTVVLGSNGGSVFEGLNMAGIIYDRNIATYVPELPSEMGCYSACAYMFFGGKVRQADGVLAVHQTGAYGSDVDKSKREVSEVQQNTQFTVSEIIGFLNEFDTPPWVYEKMFRSRDFYVFDRDEKNRLASQKDKMKSGDLNSIDEFIKNFLQHLKETEANDLEKNITTQNEFVLTDEEQKLAIAEIQKLLNAAGCNAGIADGIWGRRTQAAAILFAKTAKLPFDDQIIFSTSFVSKLQDAPANFCPKPRKRSVKKYKFASSYSVGCTKFVHGNPPVVGYITDMSFNHNINQGSFHLKWGKSSTKVERIKFKIAHNQMEISFSNGNETLHGPMVVNSMNYVEEFSWFPEPAYSCIRHEAVAW